MAAVNDFSEHSPQIDGPATHASLPSYSDSTDLSNVSRALMFLASGNVKVTTLGGETLVIPSVFPGLRIDLQVTRIWNTSTTVGAGDILVLW